MYHIDIMMMPNKKYQNKSEAPNVLSEASNAKVAQLITCQKANKLLGCNRLPNFGKRGFKCGSDYRNTVRQLFYARIDAAGCYID